MLHQRLCIVLTILVTLVSSAMVCAEDRFTIEIARHYKVGYEFHTHVTAASRRVVRLKPGAFAAELDGLVKVLAVNERTGGITELTCTVEKFKREGTDLYPAGAVISAQKSNRATSYSINGQPASRDEVSVLDAVLPMSDSSATVSDDQVFGSPQAQSVGATWPVRKDLAEKAFTEEGLPVSADAISGKSKLVKVATINGVRAMVVHSSVSAHGIEPHGTGRANVLDGSFSCDQDIVVPVDPSLPPISSSATIHLVETFGSTSGTFEVSIDTQYTRKDEPKK